MSEDKTNNTPDLPKPPIGDNVQHSDVKSEASSSSSKNTEIKSKTKSQNSQQSSQERVMEITGTKPSSIKKIKQMSKFSPNSDIPLPDLSILGIDPPPTHDEEKEENIDILESKENSDQKDEKTENKKVKGKPDKISEASSSPDSDISPNDSQKIITQIREQEISPVSVRKIKLSPIKRKDEDIEKNEVSNETPEKPIPEKEKLEEPIKAKPKKTKTNAKKLIDPITIPKLITQTKRIEFGSPLSMEASGRNREYVHMEGTGTLTFKGKKYSLEIIPGRDPSRMYIPSGQKASFECTNELEALVLLEITFVL